MSLNKLSIMSLLVLLVVCFCGATAVGSPVIQELYYDSPSTDTDNVFTEILGTPAMDLTGWSLIGINGTGGSTYKTVDLTGAVIPSDGLLVIATATAATWLQPHVDFVADVDWQNGSDSVQLIGPGAIVYDTIGYGISAFAYEGSPALDVFAGSSLSRDAFGTDTDNNYNDFTAGTPTPGVIPEPAALSLLAIGGLALLRRRK